MGYGANMLRPIFTLALSFLLSGPLAAAEAIGQARALLQEGKAGEAIVVLEREAAARPRDAVVRNMLGSLLNREGRYRQALIHAEAAARLQPDDPRYRLNRGIVLAEHGRFVEAIEDFDAALGRDPTLIYGFLERGAAWLSLDRPDRADADWRVAQGLEGALIWPVWYQATGHFVAARFAEAAAGFDGVATAEPGFSAALLWARLAHARADGQARKVAGDESWPSQLLALYEGRRTVGDMLATARRDKSTGDKRKIGEVWFVAAQQRLAAGDRRGAVQMLRQAVSVRAPRHVWKIAAERDLALLRAQ